VWLSLNGLLPGTRSPKIDGGRVFCSRNEIRIFRSYTNRVASNLERGRFQMSSRTDTELKPASLVGDQLQLKFGMPFRFSPEEERMQS